MKHLKPFALFLVLMLALAVPAFAQEVTEVIEDDFSDMEIQISGFISFEDFDGDGEDDIVVTGDPEFPDGVIIAPSSTFNPSDYEQDDPITLIGIVLNDDTFKAQELVEEPEGTDADGDGFVTEAEGGSDCDDTNAAVNPDAEEVANDGIDNDCDGEDAVDADGDGSFAGEDCDDTDATVYPGATETDGDGVDSNCDGDDNNPVEEPEEPGAGCVPSSHPVANALATEFEVSVDEIIGLHCDGNGFGNIARAYLLARASNGEIDPALLLAEHGGKAWKDLLEQYDLHPSDLAPGHVLGRGRKHQDDDAEATTTRGGGNANGRGGGGGGNANGNANGRGGNGGGGGGNANGRGGRGG